MTCAFLKVTVTKLHNGKKKKKLAYEKKRGRDTAFKLRVSGKKKSRNLINMIAPFYTYQKVQNYMNTAANMAHGLEQDLKFIFGSWCQKGWNL